jgi:type II secretory pathway component PulF
MYTYRYTIQDVDDTGDIQRGQVTAETDEEAEEKIRALYKFRIEILEFEVL